MLATTVAALLFASLVQAVTEGITYRQDTVRNLVTMADIIGTNSAAAITFGDRTLASQVLSSVRAEPSIVNGHIFDIDGNLMSVYATAKSGITDSGELDEAQEELLGDWLKNREPVRSFTGLRFVDIVQPIYLDRENIGFVHPVN